MDISKLIEQVINDGGNEIQLKIGSEPLMRKNKMLRKMNMPALVDEDIDGVINELLTPEEIKKCLNNNYSELNVFGKLPINVRFSILMSQEKPMLTIRFIENEVPTLKSTKFPEALIPIIEAKKGLFIVTGPSRSGISTTIAAITDHLSKKFGRHILMIEDPIAFNIKQEKSRVTQCQIGKDIPDFNTGLSFSKKMDIDTVIISDMKRYVPLDGILELVTTGNMVVLAMSALGFSAAIEKFALDFNEESRNYVYQVLADNLLGVCSQTLVSSMGGRALIPVFETLVMNNVAASIIQKGKPGQMDSNVSNFGKGSLLFNEYVNMLVSQNVLDKQSADSFLEYYRSTKV